MIEDADEICWPANIHHQEINLIPGPAENKAESYNAESLNSVLLSLLKGVFFRRRIRICLFIYRHFPCEADYDTAIGVDEDAQWDNVQQENSGNTYNILCIWGWPLRVEGAKAISGGTGWNHVSCIVGWSNCPDTGNRDVGLLVVEVEFMPYRVDHLFNKHDYPIRVKQSVALYNMAYS